MANNFDVQKELETLNKVEKEWTDKVNKELKDEEEIARATEDITASLLAHQRVKTNVNGSQYLIGMRVIDLPSTVKILLNNVWQEVPDKQVILVVTDLIKYEIAKGHYSPATVRSEYDFHYDLKANIHTAVEGWLRHITGLIKPEMLEDK